MMFFRRPKDEHQHEFPIYLPGQIASWAKRNDGDEVYFRGTVFRCPCGAMRFKAPGLREVEVTL